MNAYYAHFEGYTESRLGILAMTDKKELLELMDALYGRKGLDEDSPFGEIQEEALRQHEIDWRDYKNSEY